VLSLKNFNSGCISQPKIKCYEIISVDLNNFDFSFFPGDDTNLFKKEYTITHAKISDAFVKAPSHHEKQISTSRNSFDKKWNERHQRRDRRKNQVGLSYSARSSKLDRLHLLQRSSPMPVFMRAG